MTGPWLALAVLGTVHAQVQVPIQTAESIQVAAQQRVRALLPSGKATYHVTASHLDPRLRLAQCAAPLEAFLPSKLPSSAKATVGVRCAKPVAWTVYVPVTVEVEAPVLVLKRALARLASVTAADVELQTRRLPGIAAGFIGELDQLEGRHLKRNLAAGSALTADALVADVLVRRGQQVTLLAASGPFEIRAQGQALSEGAANERIRVQNLTSRKIVEGVVENASTVRVGI